MGLIPEQSFTVRVPAWWDTNKEYVLDEYPGREVAMVESGHNWDVIEVPIRAEIPNEALAAAGREVGGPGSTGKLVKVEGHVAHLRSDNLFTLRTGVDSFERIPNATPYDVAELLIDDGFLYETGGILDGGKQCYLTLLLNEPVTITGDNSTTLPYVGFSWCHDGSGSFKLRSTSIRQVCENTVSASEAEGKRLGTDFVFRHTKNVADRIEDAKAAIKGIRKHHDVYVTIMEELAAVEVTPEQRDLFVSTIVGDRVVAKDGSVKFTSLSPDTSSRVKANIEGERAKINALFFGPTIPEAHKLTGYGLFQAGGEYFDHIRAFRNKDSYVRRTLLTDSPAKANLTKTIREIVAA